MQKILEQDQALTDKIRIKDENNKIFRIAAFFSHTGDSWFWCSGLFIIWLFAHGTLQKTVAFWGIAIAVTAVFIFLLKRMIHRKRPEGNGPWPGGYVTKDAFRAYSPLLRFIIP